MGFAPAWPSAAYEFVMESMTDWAFSWPISATASARARSELCKVARLTLVIVDHVPQVVSSGVVCLAHAHRVVREVNIAVITCAS